MNIPRTFYLVEGVNPEPWTAPTFTRRGKGGFASKNARLTMYQNALAEAILEIRPDVEPLTEELAFDLWIWRELEQYETETGRKQTRHRADRSNILKATEDALQGRKVAEHPEWAGGVLFVNDVQIVDGVTTIVEQRVGVEPAILIRVGPPFTGQGSAPLGMVARSQMESRGVRWMESL